MSEGEVSGVDLARVALRAVMETARKNGAGHKAKKKPRPVTAVRHDGREPMGLGAAIGALVTERAWEPRPSARDASGAVGGHRPDHRAGRGAAVPGPLRAARTCLP
ncbi:hypothetical protein ACIOJD_33685 [Streptomyces sp. NPDC088116]|uniref:hypothetical protein n=1 Tax=Streptomyces sp. NPDC088116 TaxID=3365825 RepID=UPI0037F5D431